MQNDAGDDLKKAHTRDPKDVDRPRGYVKPELIEYGPLAKLTLGQDGSTGEGGNFTRRMCL